MIPVVRDCRNALSFANISIVGPYDPAMSTTELPDPRRRGRATAVFMAWARSSSSSNDGGALDEAESGGLAIGRESSTRSPSHVRQPSFDTGKTSSYSMRASRRDERYQPCLPRCGLICRYDRRGGHMEL